MVRGQSQLMWDGWSNIVAAIMNLYRKKSKQIPAWQLNPHLNPSGKITPAGSSRIPLNTENTEELKRTIERLWRNK